MDERKGLIEGIVQTEWQLFDRVHNEGGRADCQDDRATFFHMRGSQFAAWSTEALQSYAQDLAEAEAQGRNPLEEKYAYMMQSTAPRAYAALADRLPAVSGEKRALAEQLVARQMQATEELVQKYPHFGRTLRALHTSQDTPTDTSIETYQRGELYTYSLRTLQCLARQWQGAGASAYVLAVWQATARGYGCESLEQLDALLAKTL